MDKINLYLGDSLKELDKLIKDNVFVDYTFTSPPYNRKRNDKYSHYNDVINDYYIFSKTIIDKCIKLSKKGVFWNIQTNYYNRKDIYKLIGEYSDKIQEIFIWEKTNPMPASGKSVTNAVEYFIFF